MALRAMYKGIKKVLAPLIINRPGELAIDQDALNSELNTVFFPRSEQAVMGAKNLDISFDKTLNNAAYTKTDTGYRITMPSAATYGQLNLWYNNLPKNTDMRFATSIDYTAGVAKVSVLGTNDTWANRQIIKESSVYTDDADVELSFNTGNYKYIVVSLLASINTAAQGDVTYDNYMITLASDTDTSFSAPAMTNKELTDAVATLNGSASDQKTAINAIITAATGAADFAAFKTAMGAITPVTRSIQVTPETREEITEPEEEVKKTTRKKSTAKADTEKEGDK